MALLNQGFVRSLNLDDVIDPFLALNNLGGGSITDDMAVFADNKNNATKLVVRCPSKSGNVTDQTYTQISTPVGADGTVFKLPNIIGVFGNGDIVRIKTIVKINNAIRIGVSDQLFLQLDEPVPSGFFQPGQETLVTLNDTRFTIITTSLNGKTFVATPGAGSNEIFLEDLGYPEKLDNQGNDLNNIGTWDPDGPNNNLVTYPYITSPSLPLPSVVSGAAITYDRTYFIAFSNAINEFRLARDYSKIDLIDQIDFGFAFAGSAPPAKSIVIERINECTQDNLKNLARPIFEDDEFTYDTGVLNNGLNANFSLLETALDSANFFRFKKYLGNENNIYQEPTLDFGGNLTTSDPDGFNSSPASLNPSTNPKTPGVFILDKDNSTLSSIIRTRAYSDNTQPWELNATTSTLEYQTLRNFSGAYSSTNATNQDMQIGNMILADTSTNNALELGDATALFQGVEILTTAEANAIGPISYQGPRFTHKLPVLIEGEFYSICMSAVKNEGTAPGSS